MYFIIVLSDMNYIHLYLSHQWMASVKKVITIIM